MLQKYRVLIAFLVSADSTNAQDVQNGAPKPSAAQLAWQKAGLGVGSRPEVGKEIHTKGWKKI